MITKEETMVLNKINDSNFDAKVLKSDQPFLLDVYTRWCEPCTKFNPLLKQLSEEYQDSVRFGKIDADYNPSIVKEYNISTVPTLLYFKNGRMIKMLSGIQDRGELEDLFTGD